MTVVPVVPLVSSVSVVVSVRCCSDSGACSAPGVLGVCCWCCGDSGACSAPGVLGVYMLLVLW